MEPKALTEIKLILKKFPRASDAGLVIAPTLMLLANKLGMPGYGEALTLFNNSNILNATGSAGPSDEAGLFNLSWFGSALLVVGGRYFVGIEQTLHNVELACKGGELNVKEKG